MESMWSYGQHEEKEKELPSCWRGNAGRSESLLYQYQPDSGQPNLAICGMTSKLMENVLVVGQTPPPVNGQAVMIKGFLDGNYEGIRLHHVRMEFSRTIDEVGIFKARKLMLLFAMWADIVVGRWKSRATILYYPATGPTFLSVIRDITLLLGTRWMFRHTVLHFHAAGLTEIYPRLPWILKPFFNLAYRKVDLAIFTAKSSTPIGVELRAKQITAIPYGIPDFAGTHIPDRSLRNGVVPCILFMGILCEGKGLMTLIAACSLLQKKGVAFRVVCGGTWDAGTSHAEVKALIESHGLTEIFSFPGVLLGEGKTKAFEDADIFCFPSHYVAESSPVVLTEAMSFRLPIVTTNWRGIPDVVGESGGAFVVEPKRPDLVAQGLEALLRDGRLREDMGKRSRAWFCEHGTIDRYRHSMELSILEMKAKRDTTSSVTMQRETNDHLADLHSETE
jgi:glycosyltransferase involved in cell wall biosynthesis